MLVREMRFRWGLRSILPLLLILLVSCRTRVAEDTTALTIVATDSNGNATTYTSSTTTVCSSGTRTNLATTWRTLADHLSYGYTENPWTATIQQGTFDM